VVASAGGFLIKSLYTNILNYKRMKKINLLSLILLLTAAMFTGCEKNDPDENPAISVQDKGALTHNVFADETNGQSGVTFTTTGAWTSSISGTEANLKSSQLRAGSPAWISISPDHGDKAGNYTISISLEPNFTGNDRTAVITISCNGTDITVTVTQKSTKEDGTKPVARQTVVFEVYSCNAQWSPQNNAPYLAAEGAEIKVYKGAEEIGIYRAETAVELEPGEYTYSVTKGNETNVPGNALGFVIAGIFTSQEEIDSLPFQSGAQLGGLKFIDMNGDGIINNDDRVENGRAYLRVDADNAEMRITVYIAPLNFMPDYGVDYRHELDKAFTAMLKESYLIDAAITHQVSLPAPYAVFSNFSFYNVDSRVLTLWNQSYAVIRHANSLLEKADTENIPDEDKAGLSFYRAYAYSTLLNYFGGVPLIVTATPQGNVPRISEQEMLDFILSELDRIIASAPVSGSKHSALQIKARILLNTRRYSEAVNVLDEIINSGIYSLQNEAFTEGVDLNLPEVMRKGAESYPLRYTETLLLYAEASVAAGNTVRAIQIVNQFAAEQGQAPILSPGASQDECREAVQNLWTSRLDREGHEFARLKRIDTFLVRLAQYGAQEKHKQLPIPQQAMDMNPNLYQNPGW
jgi:hypothetical protein